MNHSIYCTDCNDEHYEVDMCKICEERYCNFGTSLKQVPLRYLIEENGFEYGEFICDDCIKRVKGMDNDSDKITIKKEQKEQTIATSVFSVFYKFFGME